MTTFFWTLVSYFARAILSLRYKIEYRGLDQLTPERLNRPDGILFMPNHPAHMDPLINFVWLWPKYRMRPLVIEYIYRLPILQPLIKLVKALPVPNFDTSVNQLKIKKAEEAIQAIADGLKKRENFIVYPGGRLKNTGKEMIGGSSGAHALVEECPNANCVLIRTTGLWGSSFSRALLGRSPDLTPTLLHGIKVLLQNFIFFAPRRKIVVEIEPNPDGLPRDGSRVEFNRFLEEWYNRYPDEQGNRQVVEPLKLVSYKFWRQDFPEVFKPKKKGGSNGGVTISEETRSKIVTEIQRILDNSNLEVTPEKHLAFDLGMDSLNIAELTVYLTMNYDVGEIHPEDFDTVQSVLEIAEGATTAPKVTHPPAPVTWTDEPKRPPPMLPCGRTIQEAFLRSCERMDSFSAIADDLIGVLTYKKLKRSVLVLAQYFRTLPDEKLAVMLPASGGAMIVTLAIQFAGKIPVMLNWTLGPRYLEEMMSLSGATKVISSWRFLDRLAHVDFGNLIDQFVLLEDIRKNLTLGMKLRGAFLAHCPISWILKAQHLNRLDENSPCVILFTSGTEANPKGVPLSHKNIISNQRSAMQCIDLRSTEVVHGILPPFHSFGYSVTGLFPILGGIKVAFYPDPTDGFALAEGVERWKVTLFCSAPSFLKGLLIAGKREQLKSVRYFVTGAEKAPEELYQKVKKLDTGAIMFEGYGITECAPILSLIRPNTPPKGVGRILPDIELCTIHPETSELLPVGSEGEICVRGPNVFNGYLGNPRTPFIEIEGKRWYRTGDLGHLEKDGTLILSGRLKRFTKVGGEMISLGAVEEILMKEFPGKDDLPSLAVIADEREPGKPRLILFTTMPIGKESANQVLLNSGMSRLVKISEVRQIEEIPLMGTGKTNYRNLQAQLEQK